MSRFAMRSAALLQSVSLGVSVAGLAGLSGIAKASASSVVTHLEGRAEVSARPVARPQADGPAEAKTAPKDRSAAKDKPKANEPSHAKDGPDAKLGPEAQSIGELAVSRWLPLKIGARVGPGHAVRTLEGGRIELKLADESRIRLGSSSQVVLDRLELSGSERRVRIDLWLGRIWAKVVRSGADGFQVRTSNAVAGVRGTSFTVVAQADLSAVVRVYAGSVGVRRGGHRRDASVKQVPGPRRVDQQQWEEVIASAMRQVRISALGEIAPAEDFEDDGAEQMWASWNQGRDADIDRRSR